MNRKWWIGIVVVSVIVAALVMVSSYPYQGAYAPVSEAPSTEFRTKEAAPSGGGADYTQEVLSEQMAPVPEQQVIKTSYINLEVTNFKEASFSISQVAAKYNGYVSDTFVQDIGGTKQGYVTIRVPEQSFYDAIRDVETLGTLKEENVSLQDVTLQYIDLTARLDNLKTEEKTYLRILDMATTVEDILKVEIQLERVRGEIESLQGTLNYMENQINYSTVQVYLREPEKVVHESRIGEALSRAVEAFLSAVRGIIIFIGYFLPIGVFLTVLAFIGQFIYKKWFKER